MLITDARRSLVRNYNHRRHTYAVLQWSRIPMLLIAAAAFLWWDMTWLATIMTILSVPMPWIAVVIANGHGEPADKRTPRVYKPGVVREANRRWEEEQRARAAALDGESAPALPTAGDEDDRNLPATFGGIGAVGPYAGFDPSTVIDMDGTDDEDADDDQEAPARERNSPDR